MSKFNELLLDNPIIAGIKSDENLKDVLTSDVKIVFVLYGSIMNIGDIAKQLKDNGKVFFIHLDLIEGLKADEQGIEFVKKYVNPYGIISTKPMHLKLAQKHDLPAILRLFIIDSMSLKTAIDNTNKYKPMAIEVMPGVATAVVSKIKDKVNVPVIAGGLIEEKEDVLNSLQAGAVAISTSSKKVWGM